MLRRSIRWLQSRGQRRGLILLYHRVAETAADPFRICVSPAQFAGEMQVLSQAFTPMSLEEMVVAAGSGTLPPRAVAVTFDDGYLDNLECALPILEQHQIPATFFVVTGNPGQQFWWDRLAHAVYTPNELRPRLTLTIMGNLERLQVQDNPAGRRRLVLQLHRLLLPVAEAEREAVLADLHAWAGSEQCADAETRLMSDAELLTIAASGCVTIGAHTMTHPRLSTLSVEQQRDELRQSKSHLESIIQAPVTSFSYPFGMPEDFTDETLRLVKQEGYQSACTNLVGVVTAGSDHFQLPRYWIGNWSASQFRRRLSRWL